MRSDDTTAVSTTDLHPWHVAGDAHAATAIGLRVPRRENFSRTDNSHTGTLYLVDQCSRSWATLHVTIDPPYQVRQGGQRKLFDEVANAYHWWVDAGEPTVGAWRFTITPGGQQVELRGPVPAR
jgi:hypothetical protein